MAQDLGDAALVARLGVGVQQADRDRFDVLAHKLVGERPDRVLVERDQYVAARVDPFIDAEAALARHQRRRLVHIDVVLLEAAFGADLDGVAKALGDDHCGPRTLAFDNGVGRQCRAVDDEPEITRRQPGVAERAADTFEHTLLGRARRRQDLAGEQFVTRLDGNVGKGAADIHGHTRGHSVVPSLFKQRPPPARADGDGGLGT